MHVQTSELTFFNFLILGKSGFPPKKCYKINWRSWSYKQNLSKNLCYAHFRAPLLVEILEQPILMLKNKHSLTLRWKYLYRIGPRSSPCSQLTLFSSSRSTISRFSLSMAMRRADRPRGSQQLMFRTPQSTVSWSILKNSCFCLIYNWFFLWFEEYGSLEIANYISN